MNPHKYVRGNLTSSIAEVILATSEDPFAIWSPHCLVVFPNVYFPPSSGLPFWSMTLPEASQWGSLPSIPFGGLVKTLLEARWCGSWPHIPKKALVQTEANVSPFSPRVHSNRRLIRCRPGNHKRAPRQCAPGHVRFLSG
jgi:hypothetical protein